MFSLAHPAVASGGKIGVRRMLDEATANVTASYQDDVQAQAMMRRALARIQMDIGDLDGAAHNLDAIPAQAMGDAVGDLEREVLTARLEHYRGQFDPSESRLRTILADDTPPAQDMEPLLVEAHGILGKVLIERLDYVAATPVLATAVKRGRLTLGPDDPVTIEMEAWLGRAEAALVMLGADNAPDPAAPPPYRSVERVIDVLGPTHPATFLARLADSDRNYITSGSTPDILATQAAIYADASEALGQLHPRTLETSIELGNMYRATGNLVEAERLLREAISGYDATYGPGHSHAAMAAGHLGNVLSATGRWNEAAGVHERVWRTCVELWGPHEVRTVDARLQMTIALLELDRLDEVVNDYPDVLSDYVEYFFTGRSPDYYQLRMSYLEAAQRAGRHDLLEAEATALRRDIEAHLDTGSDFAVALLDRIDALDQQGP